MNERQQAAADLRRIADNRIVTDSVAMNLEFIADLIESHGERVVDLLTYNNLMLDENREQRRLIRELRHSNNALVGVIATISARPESDEEGIAA